MFLLPALHITEDVIGLDREQHLVVCGFGGIRSRSVQLDVVHWTFAPLVRLVYLN